ncbi:hypothetical protein [Desulfobacca acetoxidans]
MNILNTPKNFIALYFQDKLTIVNPAGTIAVLTLWSKVDYFMERFRQAGVNLDPGSSPISAAPSIAQTDDIKLLGKERYKIRWQQYASDNPALELVGEPIAITGRKV